MLFSLFPFLSASRKNKFFLQIATTTCFLLSSSVAMAQVSVNQSALDNLGTSKKTTSEHKKSQKEKKHSSTKKDEKKNTKHKQKNTKTSDNQAKTATSSTKPIENTAKPVLPTIPNAPPPVPVFKDADITVPLHPPAPPPMPTVVKSAKGSAQVTKQHTLIIFSDDSDALNENMMKAIMDVANMLKQHKEERIVLNAYSHGTVDDPSTPRRTALNRGLAIRSVLINQGIPSTRIYLLAKGMPQQPLPNVGSDYVELISSDLVPSKPSKKGQ